MRHIDGSPSSDQPERSDDAWNNRSGHDDYTLTISGISRTNKMGDPVRPPSRPTHEKEPHMPDANPTDTTAQAASPNSTTDQPTLAVSQAQADIAFVERFGASWLDGSVSAKTVLLAYLVKSRTNSEPRPAGDLREAALRKCMTCGGCGWVCENHRDKPWKGALNDYMACECGAGAPCGSCNLAMASADFVEPYRQIALDAVSLLESAERETNWGNPMFGPSPSESIQQQLDGLATHSPAPMAGEDHAEIKKVVRWIDQAIERAKKHGATEGIWLFASQWRTVRAVLAAAHPTTQEGADRG